MSRNTKPIKPIKGKNVSAVYLYVSPEVKKFWYNFYEDVFRKEKNKPSISEFLSGIVNQYITGISPRDHDIFTITCTAQDRELWDKIRLDESPDPEDPQTWSEFITSKVNAGINLLDEIQTTAPETGKLENKVIELSGENVRLLQQIADLKEQLKRKDVMDHRLVLRESLIKIIATADKPLRYTDVRLELNKRNVTHNPDAVYPALTDLVADDIIKMDIEGNSEYFSKL